MTDASAAFYDAGFSGGRVVSRGARRVFRRLAGHAAIGLAAVAAVALSAATVTLGAAWIANTTLSKRPLMQERAPAGPGTLTLGGGVTAGIEPASFADKWSRATASMQVGAMPIATPRTELADIAPTAAPELTPSGVVPLPPLRPVEMANIVPLPRPYPGEREIATASLGKIEPPPAPRIAAAASPPAEKPVVPKVAAAPAPAEKRVASREAPEKPKAVPGLNNRTAVYDIEAHTVYLPNGERLEAHSGLGDKMDDPRYFKVRMRGPTPPNIYALTLREEIFHGVRAIRLNPVDDDKMFGRAGMLAHTYMLGPNGQSNGCVSFRDYDKFLRAFLKGEVDRMVVVARLDDAPSRVASARVAYEQRGYADRFAANF